MMWVRVLEGSFFNVGYFLTFVKSQLSLFHIFLEFEIIIMGEKLKPIMATHYLSVCPYTLKLLNGLTFLNSVFTNRYIRSKVNLSSLTGAVGHMVAASAARAISKFFRKL